MQNSSRSLTLTILALGWLCLALTPGALAQRTKQAPAAQTRAAKIAGQAIPALMVSDIHFDPFHDPGKVQALVAAPVSKWQSILAAPASANQQADFAKLQESCHAKGVDTPFVLLRSSLEAMRARQPDAKFITVSGDLIAHAFTCRFSALVPGAAPGDYQAFVVKTLSFVMEELRTAFPGVPVYAALGNNDSGCGDYKLDANSDFLTQAGRIFAEGLPAQQRAQALKEFGATGSYSVLMAAPMRGTRLIVLNDLFLSPKYSTCGGKPDPNAAAGELAWLEQALEQARQAGEKVWVIGHIPPGIDPYSTVAKFRDVCGGKSPVTFLANDKLADLLARYGDVVRLGIFAHTHMDEMRLLRPEENGAAATGAVAIKMVPSISPVDGNNPTFTVARVDPATALLENYDVIAASNQSGVDTRWTPAYDFGQTFHEAQFSSTTVKKLIEGFRADGEAKTGASQAYIRNYFVGDMSRELSPFWPEYVCALDNHTAKGFAGCVCGAAK
jgi:sphingomyelin phosphodiesterase acid-like 3